MPLIFQDIQRGFGGELPNTVVQTSSVTPMDPAPLSNRKYCLRYQKLAAGLWPVIELLLSSEKDAIYGAIRRGNSEGT